MFGEGLRRRNVGAGLLRNPARHKAYSGTVNSRFTHSVGTCPKKKRPGGRWMKQVAGLIGAKSDRQSANAQAWREFRTRRTGSRSGGIGSVAPSTQASPP